MKFIDHKQPAIIYNTTGKTHYKNVSISLWKLLTAYPLLRLY